MQFHCRMVVEKGLDLLRLVGGKIVENDMDFPVSPTRGHNLLEKIDELITGMSGGGLAVYLA